jgi:tetratricopeptide (TPR) repeat protein
MTISIFYCVVGMPRAFSTYGDLGRIAVTAGTIISVLMLAQSAAAVAGEDAAKQSDAAYNQLTAGQTDAAIAHLEVELARNADDPALLINLGTAYFRANRIEESREAFRRAAASEQRYSVERPTVRGKIRTRSPGARSIRSTARCSPRSRLTASGRTRSDRSHGQDNRRLSSKCHVPAASFAAEA